MERRGCLFFLGSVEGGEGRKARKKNCEAARLLQAPKPRKNRSKVGPKIVGQKGKLIFCPTFDLFLTYFMDVQPALILQGFVWGL